jgi:flavin reductase (DIM6/NTAB) family NADH-FMN oxidoreductase RutF
MVNADQDQLRLVMRHWTTGITVVSTQYQGVRHGMTVSSFTSVSLEPQVVTISLAKSSRTHDLIQSAGSFGITILSADQQNISELFAGQTTESEDRFKGLETLTLESGAPFIKAGLAFLDCDVIAVHDFGTNSLFIGEVVAAKVGESGKPIVYYDQQYHQLQD